MLGLLQLKRRRRGRFVAHRGRGLLRLLSHSNPGQPLLRPRPHVLC
jgi:hypothetical protein